MDKEKYFAVDKIKGRYQECIADAVAKALSLCCEQEPEFEQAIEQSGKTFQECLDTVIKGVGSSISDLDTYNRAVKFYFTTAEVHFNMQIDLSGGNGCEAPPIEMHKSESIAEKPKQSLDLSLDDLLGDL